MLTEAALERQDAIYHRANILAAELRVTHDPEAFDTICEAVRAALDAGSHEWDVTVGDVFEHALKQAEPEAPSYLAAWAQLGRAALGIPEAVVEEETTGLVVVDPSWENMRALVAGEVRR